MSTRGLSLRRISGHCTVSAEKVYAWYRLAPQAWSFRPDGVREQLIRESADALAQLAKWNLHFRVTTRPYPVSCWAQAHDANAPAPLDCWREHLVTDQMHLARRSMADKEVSVGVEILGSRRILHALGGLAFSVSDREVAALEKPIRSTDEVMALSGMAGTLASPRELEWLLHRSVSLGLPAPLTLGAVDDNTWATDDLGEFTDQVHWSAVPFGRTVTVQGEANGQQVTRHVCVMSVRLRDEGRSESTTAKAYRLLRAILNAAVDDGRITRNPCRIKGADRENPPERPVASVEEVFALADKINPRYRAFILTAALASLRWGELVALRRRDVDLDAGLLFVHRAMVERGGHLEIALPKNGKTRTVALPRVLVDELKAHLANVDVGSESLMFTGDRGATPRRGNWRANVKWSSLVSAVGLPSGFRFHDLRHTGNHLAAQTGASTRELMQRMGHSTVRAAMIYQHATDARSREVANRLDALVKDRRGSQNERSAGSLCPSCVPKGPEGIEHGPDLQADTAPDLQKRGGAGDGIRRVGALRAAGSSRFPARFSILSMKVGPDEKRVWPYFHAQSR